MPNSIRRSGSTSLAEVTPHRQQRPRIYLVIGWIVLIAAMALLILLTRLIIVPQSHPGIPAEHDRASLSMTAEASLTPTDPPHGSAPAPNMLMLAPLVHIPDQAIASSPSPAPSSPRGLVDTQRNRTDLIRVLSLSDRATITTTTILSPTLEPLSVRVVRADQWVFAGEGHDLRGEPTLSGDKIDAILAYYGSPAMGSGSSWEKMSRQYGIDNAYALAFFVIESSAGTNPSWSGRKADGSTTHNVGNIVCSGYPRCYGRWRDYATWEEGIADWYRLIAEEYINARNVATLEQIVPIYAPAFENDVPRYIAGVLRLVAWFHGVPANQWPPMPPSQLRSAAQNSTPAGGTPIAEPPPLPGAIRMPDLIGMHIEDAYRVLAEQGIMVGVVDKQGREHIPHLFDQVAPDTVVSSLPYVDNWVIPGAPVVLGVRAPEAAAHTEPPTQPDPATPSPIESAMPIATPTATNEPIALPLPIELAVPLTPIVAPLPMATPEPVAPVEDGMGSVPAEEPTVETP